MSANEYLREKVTPAFVWGILREVMTRVIGREDFHGLEDFREFLHLQFLAPPESQIETELRVTLEQDYPIVGEGEWIKAYPYVDIVVGLKRGDISVDVPLTGYLTLLGSAKSLEWHEAEVRIQVSVRNVLTFEVREKAYGDFEIREIFEEEDTIPKKGKRRTA